MQLLTDPRVNERFAGYPDHVRPKMEALKQLVIDTAGQTEGVDQLEVTLKWNEPSFVTRHGSTVRMDWKPKTPDRYALYFQCTTSLVDTFKALHNDTLQFEGNRAIVLPLEGELPEHTLRDCIAKALRYHKLKHLPLLGG